MSMAGTGAGETGVVAEPDKQSAASEAAMRMPLAGQPQMPFPGMPMMHMRPGMPGMPPNFRGMVVPFVRLNTFFIILCSCCYCTAELCTIVTVFGYVCICHNTLLLMT